MSGYHISDSPSVGDVVVDGLVIPGTLVQRLDDARYRVVRVDYNTGRGTVRHVHTNKALQIVRGRFHWCLADGTRRPIRFVACVEVTEQDGSTTLGIPHSNVARLGDVAQPVNPTDQDGYVWEVSEVADSGSWILVRRTDDRSYCQAIMRDAAACWRTPNGVRTWFVTPLERQPLNAQGRVTCDDVKHKSKITSLILREDGSMRGTMFYNPQTDMWNSAYPEDGEYETRLELAEAMLSVNGRQLRAETRARRATQPVG